MTNNDIFIQLEEDYGLDVILQQNDIEPWQVVELLYLRGLLDLEDYMFKDLEIDGED